MMAEESRQNKSANFAALVENSNGVTKTQTSKSGTSKKLVIKNFKGKHIMPAASYAMLCYAKLR